MGVTKDGFRQVRINWKDVFKFLAGASFVNAGVLFYLYLTNTAVPVLGTTFRNGAGNKRPALVSAFPFLSYLLLFWLCP